MGATTTNLKPGTTLPSATDAEVATPVCDAKDTVRARGLAALTRYVPLLTWTLVLATLLVIPLRIISYGFLAPGDARRHVAKVFTDKPYTEIIVMGPEYQMDHSPGWEWFLRVVQRGTGWGSDELMSFSIISLMLCIFLAPLPWVSRPEAWLAALLAELIALPELMTRLVQARPYMLTEGILIALLFVWSREDQRRPSTSKLVLSSLGIALSVWVHGAWYLWVLPLGAFFLAGRWRAGFSFLCCTTTGTIVGAIITGRPITFLKQALQIIASVSAERVPSWLLVGEFRPSYGEFATALLVGIVLLWRKQQNRDREGCVDSSGNAASQLTGPAFWLMVICWILGFKADRFWADWGLPAVLVWLTLQLQQGSTEAWHFESPKRLLACGLVAIPLFLHSTNDLDRRYTGNLGESFLDANQPALQGWMPEANGILYSAHMDLFYSTFYKNPRGPWRYILGMEPALMPSADLRIFRDIQLSQYAFKAYAPWVQKMSAADRLAIRCSGRPPISELEWTNAIGDVWLGRLPQTK